MEETDTEKALRRMAEGPQEVEDEEVLLEPGELPPFWKPEKEGEQRIGELLGIQKLPFSDCLRLKTDDGIIAIPVSFSMEGVNFWALKGKLLRFIFKGYAETKAGNKVKLFKITKVRSEEDTRTPF